MSVGYFLLPTLTDHFNHKNIIKYCDRPFNSVKHMNAMMIAKWNTKVGHDDLVIHLGDFAMGDRRMIPSILEKLNGRLIVLAGNHDNKRSDKYYVEIVREPFIYIDEQTQLVVELVHNPRDVSGIYDLAFCGHVHEAWDHVVPLEIIQEHSENRPNFRHKVLVPTINVGVDVWDFEPVSFAQIFEKHSKIMRNLK